MKVIRAKRGIFVPLNPEKPMAGATRLVPSGVVALVPSDYKGDPNNYDDVGTFKERKPKASGNKEEKEI